MLFGGDRRKNRAINLGGKKNQPKQNTPPNKPTKQNHRKSQTKNKGRMIDFHEAVPKATYHLLFHSFLPNLHFSCDGFFSM